MSKFNNLKKNIEELSINKNFNLAKNEWEVYNVIKVDEPERCLCNHYPILELCYIKNTHNKLKTIVGNCCVKHFGIDTDWYFYNINRISQNKRPNKKFLDYLYAENKIKLKEYQFMLNMINKKKITPGQQRYQDIMIQRIQKSL